MYKIYIYTYMYIYIYIYIYIKSSQQCTLLLSSQWRFGKSFTHAIGHMVTDYWYQYGSSNM